MAAEGQELTKECLTKKLQEKSLVMQDLQALSKANLDQIKEWTWKWQEPYSGQFIDAKIGIILAARKMWSALDTLIKAKVVDPNATTNSDLKLPLIFLAADRTHEGRIDGEYYEAESQDEMATSALLIKHDTNVWARASDNDTAISAALRAAKATTAKCLLENMCKSLGPNHFANVVVEYTQPPVTLVDHLAGRNQIDMLKIIATKAPKNITGITMGVNGGTILHSCAKWTLTKETHKELASLVKVNAGTVDVMSYGAQISGHMQDSYNITPLHDAALHGCQNQVEALVEEGANTNNSTTDGLIPAMFAAISLNFELAKYLVQHTSTAIILEARGCSYNSQRIYGKELFPDAADNKPHTSQEWFDAAGIVTGEFDKWHNLLGQDC